MSEFEDLLRGDLAAAADLGFPRVELSQGQMAGLSAHYDLLIRWNSRMNLTAIRTIGEAVRLHYCESLIFGASMKVAVGTKIADVGSGAGFPGVAMAILRPDCEFALIESHLRKGVFLQEAARGMANVRVMTMRVESVEGTWDCLVSRAVRMTNVLNQIPRLAGSVGLLVGQQDVHLLPADRRMEWNDPIRLPWGDHRYALFGTARRST